MNLMKFLTVREILNNFVQVPTLNPKQLCFQCEKPLVRKSHYHLQTSGASGRSLAVQVCPGCHRTLLQEAKAQESHPSLAAAPELPKPEPINLGSIYAPRPATPPATPTLADLFQEDPNAL